MLGGGGEGGTVEKGDYHTSPRQMGGRGSPYI